MIEDKEDLLKEIHKIGEEYYSVDHSSGGVSFYEYLAKRLFSISQIREAITPKGDDEGLTDEAVVELVKDCYEEAQFRITLYFTQVRENINRWTDRHLEGAGNDLSAQLVSLFFEKIRHNVEQKIKALTKRERHRPDREKIAQNIYFEGVEYEVGSIAEITWREAPQARRDVYLKRADQILALFDEKGE